MRARKLKKLLYERPYLVDSVFVLSDAEAAYLIERHGYLSMDSIVRNAKEKAGLPEATWADVDARMQRRATREERATRSKSAVRARRWLAIAAAVLLLAGFFSFVPVGQAIIKEAAGFIIRLFDDGYSMGENTDSLSPDIVPGTVEYASIEDYEQETGRYVLRIVSKHYPLSSVTLYRDPTGETLVCCYTQADGGNITVQQIWAAENSYGYGSKNPEEVWEFYTLKDGTQLNYFIDAVDGSFNCIAALRDSYLFLISNSQVDYEQMLDCVVY